VGPEPPTEQLFWRIGMIWFENETAAGEAPTPQGEGTNPDPDADTDPLVTAPELPVVVAPALAPALKNDPELTPALNDPALAPALKNDPALAPALNDPALAPALNDPELAPEPPLGPRAESDRPVRSPHAATAKTILGARRSAAHSPPRRTPPMPTILPQARGQRTRWRGQRSKRRDGSPLSYVLTDVGRRKI
jgi:hypothetical protein